MNIEDIPSVWALPDDPYRLPMVEPGIYHPTFEELRKLEPGLTELANAARHYQKRRSRTFCANSVWYRELRPRLVLLVGWGSRHPEPVMRSQEGYDIAYDTIYSLLPDCRGCSCL
jgi:hypothetical protein